MNRSFHKGVVLLVIAGLGVLTGIVQAQDEPPATPPVNVEVPDQPANPAAPPAPPATNVEAPDQNAADATTPAADQNVDTSRTSRRGRHHNGSERVQVGGNSTLNAGERADTVVSVFGNSTSSGDAGDVVSVMGDTRVTGGSAQDVVAVAGNVYLNAKANGDVVASFGNVELGPQAEVNGDVVVVGGTLKRDPAAIVHGDVQNVLSFASGSFGSFEWLRPWARHCLILGRPLAIAPGLGWAWSLALGFLALYVLIGFLFRDTVDRSVRTFEAQPGRCVVAALLTTFLTPVMFALLFITVIGIAFIPLAALGLFLLGLFGKAVVLAWIGRTCMRLGGEGRAVHTALAVALGGVVITLLYLVPFVGFIVYKALGILGLGVAVYALIQNTKERRGGGGPELAMAGGSVGGGSATFREPTIGETGRSPASTSSTWDFGRDASPGASGTSSSFDARGASEAARTGRASPEAWDATASRTYDVTGTHGAGALDAGASASGTGPGASNAGSGASGVGAGASNAGSGVPGAESGAAGAHVYGTSHSTDAGDTSRASETPNASDQASRAAPPPPPPPPRQPPLNNTAALTYPRAGFGIRMAALFIDVILVAVLLGIVDSTREAELIALATYGAVMWKLKGTTIGGIVFGLQVVRLDGRPIDWATSTVRALSCFLSLVVAGLGFIWIAFDEGNQAWHDKIAGTAVVRVPKGVSLL
jgi:uncharacterized RDD family membrane protein YckC